MKNALHIKVWEEDGGWIVQCLNIPGCISEGDTRLEALMNIDEAITGCLEVMQEDRDRSPKT